MSQNSEFVYAGKWLVFVLLAIVLCTLGGFAWKYYMAPVAGKADAEWKIESADSRIGNYEKYFDQCAAIQGYEGSIEVQEAALKAATAPEDKSRLQTVIAGIKAQRSRAIAQYNADVRKVYTQARFKDSSLPQQLDDSTTGGKTQCVN